MPPPSATADLHAKALAINLDPSIYGTIAEIGAGQEVARWFLRVGASSRRRTSDCHRRSATSTGIYWTRDGSFSCNRH